MASTDEKEAQGKENTKGKFKLSEDAARDQMQRLMDSYDIDANDLEIENGPEWVATVINRLVRAIRSGHVEILDNGEVRHNLVHPKGEITSIIYKRLDGTAMKERDKAKGQTEKDFVFMGSLCNSTSSGMAKMDPVDISIMQRLAQLFMVV